MAALTLHILKPSVNNMAVRVFVRAAKLDFTEDDAWGKTRSPEFLKKNPAHMTPMLEGAELPKGALWESCAIMTYLANAHNLSSFYPANPGQRAMIDSAMFYIIGTLYPLVARATYPALGFPHYPGEVGATSLDQSHKAEAQKAAMDAIAEPLDSIRQFFLGDHKFIGGAHPSVADIRLASTLEFLKAVDYAFPAWASKYMADMESALGTAYSEPAADVRGYIDYVKSQKK